MAWASNGGYLLSFVVLIVGCAVIVAGASLEVVADLAMLPGDAFVRAICRRTKVRFGRVRTISDVSMSAIGFLICWIVMHSPGSVREGTLVSAALVGLMIGKLGHLTHRAGFDQLQSYSSQYQRTNTKSKESQRSMSS